MHESTDHRCVMYSMLTVRFAIPFQIKHNRLTLLQHPLVKDYLYEKFWLMTFPLLLLNLLFNIALLVTLNWFALVVPRPGPYSETCKKSELELLAIRVYVATLNIEM